MINLLLVWMSLPVMAQDIINPNAVLEKIAPIVAAGAPSYDLFEKSFLPKPPKPVLVQNRLRDSTGEPLINDGLWLTLEAPNSAISAWASSQVQGLDISQVRMMPFPAIDAIARAAVAAKDNLLTFMTDDGLTTPHIYYLGREVCQELFSKYDFGAITVESGIAHGGYHFQIQAMLLGDNKVQVLYNWDNFEFSNSEYPQYPFILSSLVTYSIEGPGNMDVHGIKVDAGIVNAVIQNIQDTHNGYLQVDTSHGQQFVKSTPITVISPIRR